MFEIEQGNFGKFAIVLTDPNTGQRVDFEGTEPILWTLSLGENRPALVSGSGAWTDAPQGELEILLPTATTASLAPGWYLLRATIDNSGEILTIHRGGLRLLPSPDADADATAKTYTTYDDLDQLAAGWLDKLVDVCRDGNGFARQQQEARQWLDRQILARAERTLNSQVGRYGGSGLTFDSTSGPMLGADRGAFWGLSLTRHATIQEALDELREILDADGLVIDDAKSDGTGRDIAAHYALHLICRPHIGRGEGDTPYQRLARTHRQAASRMLAGWRAPIDTDDDGLPNIYV